MENLFTEVQVGTRKKRMDLLENKEVFILSFNLILMLNFRFYLCDMSFFGDFDTKTRTVIKNRIVKLKT